MAERDNDSGLHVLVTGPLDFFVEWTVDIDDWATSPVQVSEVVRACFAVAKCKDWDGVQRGYSGRVAYDAASDSHYFIFKLDNNGTTFLVGESIPYGVDGNLYFVPDGRSTPTPIGAPE